MKRFIKLFMVLVIIVMTFGCTKKEEQDGYKFKIEYEKLNGEVSESGKEIRSIKIDEDNPFVYATASDIVKKINDKDTFIVYFGFSSCPWCRSIIPTLVDVLEDNKVDKIYYVDVLDIRDKYELDSKNVAKKTKDGSKDYDELIKLLDSVLDEYTLKNSKGKEIKVKEKRIYAPNIVTVVKGTPKEKVTGIPKDLEDPYMTLSEEMIEDSYNQLECAVKCLNEKNTCDKSC